MAGNHHNTTSGQRKCKNSLIWLQNLQKCKMSKNHIVLQVRGHRKLPFFFIFTEALKMAGNHHNMTLGHIKCNNSVIWLETCEKFKNHIFLQVRGHRKLHFFYFIELLKMAGNHHNMTSGHLNFNNSLNWLQNLKKCEMIKSNIFVQVRGHQKLPFFLFLSKALKMAGNHHNTTWGHLKCNNSLIWLQSKSTKCP